MYPIRLFHRLQSDIQAILTGILSQTSYDCDQLTSSCYQNEAKLVHTLNNLNQILGELTAKSL